MRSGHLVTVVVTVVVMGTGVLIGLLAGGGEDPPTEAQAPLGSDAQPEPATPPMLGTSLRADDETVTRLSRRVAALETEVADLRAQLKDALAKAGPLLELYAKAHESGGIEVVGGPVASGAGTPLAGEVLGGTPLARRIAQGLGLDAKRRDAFTAEYERLLQDVKALEKRHAEVTRDGDTTTIRIGRYGSEGGQLRQRWKDFVEGHLTPEELEAYRKEASDNRLLGNRMGDQERTISIKEAGGSVTVEERGGDGTGNETRQQMQGPAIARDMILEDYAHLLE